MKGEITVSSKLGTGSIFTVKFKTVKSADQPELQISVSNLSASQFLDGRIEALSAQASKLYD